MVGVETRRRWSTLSAHSPNAVFGITPDFPHHPKKSSPSGLPALPGSLFKLMIERLRAVEVPVDSMAWGSKSECVFVGESARKAALFSHAGAIGIGGIREGA